MREKPTKKAPGREVNDPENPPLTAEQLEHLREGIPNTRAIRRRLEMTQEEFADAFGFSLSSIRHQEQGRHAPDEDTLAYLRTIARKTATLPELRREHHAELSTEEAADVLDVSRSFLVRLLDEGKIPCCEVGKHGSQRRVSFVDLMRYRRSIDRDRLAALEELTAQAQELDMGYEPDPPPRAKDD